MTWRDITVDQLFAIVWSKAKHLPKALVAIAFTAFAVAAFIQREWTSGVVFLLVAAQDVYRISLERLVAYQRQSIAAQRDLIAAKERVITAQRANVAASDELCVAYHSLLTQMNEELTELRKGQP